MNTELMNILSSFPAHIFCKDLHGYYILGNKTMLEDLSIKSVDELKGHQDKDLVWEHSAPLLQDNDQKIIRKKNSQTFLEPVNISNGKNVLLYSYKSPFIECGKLKGVVGLSIVMKDFAKQLTPREKECVYYLSNGYSVKKNSPAYGNIIPNC